MLEDEESGPGPGSGFDGNDGLEPLSCVACRSRKLKCDRVRGICTRCAKLKAVCVYPESRRKPAFKRRNVRELEERLAQVEVLLKDAAGKTAAQEINRQDGGASQAVVMDAAQSDDPEAAAMGSGFHDPIEAPKEDGMHDPLTWSFADDSPRLNQYGNTASSGADPSGCAVPFSAPDMQYKSGADGAGTASWELLGLGMFEALPPTEMIEELHETYFTKQHPLIPILHPGRYISSFYSAPHLRPPMALQYTIWTMAANRHEKYRHYHDAFYRRARRYLEEDELRGDGEHFITIAHAQAWALLATNEARCMWFTRAAMSAARCIKLLQMMGLHRLDDPNAEHEMAPTIAPPKDWTELEERRRAFWGAFTIDSHASISTGWPMLIDTDEVTTHLPSSEEAFNQCREETTCRLQDVFAGSPYSSFAGAAVICHLFNRIMKQVHRSRPDDSPDDYEYGKYWNRHRELDNILSSTFMFLPERFRLPAHLRDPVAVHTNLNLHASVICLHNSALEMADEHNLPDYLKATIKARLATASQEVVNIVKMTSHSHAGYRSPLVALALYVASSVVIMQVQEDGLKPKDKADLEFLLSAMDAIGKQHMITLSFLRQVMVDLDRMNLTHRIRVPKLSPLYGFAGEGVSPCGNNIPLFARSRASRHKDMMPPLPGRLPLNKPIGRKRESYFMMKPFDSQVPKELHRDAALQSFAYNGLEAGNANKRKRVDEPSQPLPNNDPFDLFQSSAPVEEVSPSDNTPGDSSVLLGAGTNGPHAWSQKAMDGMAQFRLPHRGGSSTSGSSPSAVMNSNPTTASSGVSTVATNTGATVGTTSPVDVGINLTERTSAAEMFEKTDGQSVLDEKLMSNLDMDMFQELNSWDGAANEAQDPSAEFAPVIEAMLHDDSWMVLNEAGNLSWDPGTVEEGQ